MAAPVSVPLLDHFAALSDPRQRNRGKSSGTGAFFSCADSSPWTLYIMCCRHAPFLR